jgi:hypothetical protein
MRKIGLCAMAVIYGVVAGGVVPLAYAQETKTGEGALVGGLLGAVAGGVIGKQKHKTTQGVLIGGAVGALGGAAVGSQMKSGPAATTTPAASQPAAAVSQATPATSKVTMKQVIYWTEQGLPSDEIIARIKKTDSVFVLTADDIDYLQGQKVSQRVIEAMQETGLPAKK